MKKGIDYIGVGAGAVILSSEGKVFLAKRGKGARNESGKWEFPGGGVDFNETLEHAIVREVMEEYGLEIEIQELLDVVDHIIPAEKQHWVSPTFICRAKNGVPRIREPHKCEAIGWFELDRIPEDQLTIASKKSLGSLKKRNSLGKNNVMKTPYTFPIDAILLLGPTGVGKSPLGDNIAQNGLFGRTCHHLDFGSELRGAVSGGRRSAAYSPTELDFIHGVLESGLLLENEHFTLAEKIISLYLDRVGFAKHDVLVLNGIPRHAGQARDIATIATVHAVVVLECAADDIVRRIQENVGGDRTERIDDDNELIKKKLSLFRERTTPLIDHYTQQGCALYRISVLGNMTPEETFSSISALASAYPPVALVTEPPQR